MDGLLLLGSLGTPALVLSLAMQGFFNRGFKDTRSPFTTYATAAGDIVSIILDPIFIFIFRMGVSGAAVAHVISQCIIYVEINAKVTSYPLVFKIYKSRDLLKMNLITFEVIAVTFCLTVGAALAARLDPIPMAVFQICLQIWLPTSLLADGLAVAGQAILASAFVTGDYEKATVAASRVLQTCSWASHVGVGSIPGHCPCRLAAVLQFASRLFSEDANVLQHISLGIPFVAVLSQSMH